MLRVLVLEDEEFSRKALVSILQNISEEITVDAAADLVSARKLLGSTVSFDLFLLDVNLDCRKQEDVSGIQFAEEVRAMRQYEFTPLVMVTSVAGMEMEAYRKLHCYQYLVKPFEKEEIQELVKKVLFHIHAKERPSVIVKKNGINYKIDCDDIVFCKAIPRGVSLFLKKEQMEIPYLTIRQLMEKLPGEQFVQCHRIFIVNQNAVKYYDPVNQMMIMDGYDMPVDVGVTFKTEMKKIFQDVRNQK